MLESVVCSWRGLALFLRSVTLFLYGCGAVFLVHSLGVFSFSPRNTQELHVVIDVVLAARSLPSFPASLLSSPRSSSVHFCGARRNQTRYGLLRRQSSALRAYVILTFPASRASSHFSRLSRILTPLPDVDTSHNLALFMFSLHFRLIFLSEVYFPGIRFHT